MRHILLTWGFLFVILMAMPTPLFSTTQDEEIVDQFMLTIIDLERSEQIQALFNQANNALLREEPTLAIAFAERARSLAPNNVGTNATADSIIRLATLQLNERGKYQEEVNWSTDDNITDQNRYLFLANLNLDNYKLDWEGNPPYARAGLGLNIEAFLPFLSRQFGFSFSYASQFIDFSFPKLSSDFSIMQYSAFFIWRVNWRIPTVEVSSTMAIKIGLAGQYLVKNNDFHNENISLPRAFLLPKFGVTLNDPIISRFISNSFTKNLFLNVDFGFEWLPLHPTKESIALEFSVGLFYHLGNFAIGPLYHFRYHRFIKENQILTANRWALSVSYTIY